MHSYVFVRNNTYILLFEWHNTQYDVSNSRNEVYIMPVLC